jgi:hypothetical protein
MWGGFTELWPVCIVHDKVIVDLILYGKYKVIVDSEFYSIQKSKSTITWYKVHTNNQNQRLLSTTSEPKREASPYYLCCSMYTPHEGLFAVAHHRSRFVTSPS